MTVSTDRDPTSFDPAVNARVIEMIRTGAVALAVLLSGFVQREPAPYELFLVVLIPVWALFGLRISRNIAPLLVLLILFNVGGMIAMSQMADLATAPMYIAVSLFLAFTSIFFAAIIEAQPRILTIIFRTWVLTAVVTATLGILGYFDAFPGADIFTRYNRAAGAFKDPNVFGPYLVLPGLFLLHRIMTAEARTALFAVPPLFMIILGIFLSFSRGAWGLFVFSAAVMTLALLIHNQRGIIRLRILLMCLAAVVVVIVGLIIAWQIPAIASLLEQRGQLVQDYDGARLGRFARHLLGFEVALEHPFGIGPLAFGQIYGQDTHNIWLKALLDYSWLGFAAYFTLIIWTIAGSFRILFRVREWQPFLLCTFAAFIGHIGLGTVIDTDHWRHLYLIIGMLWGMMALEQRHQASLRSRTDQ